MEKNFEVSAQTQNQPQPRTHHVQLDGQTYYDEGKMFMFCPDNPVPGQVARFSSWGKAQQMSDGTFDFVPCQPLRSKSVLIKKVAHGRLSATKDNAIQLTLKVFKSEGLDIKQTILKEAKEALED